MTAVARAWDDFDPDVADFSGSREETQATEDAHRWAFEKGREQFGGGDNATHWGYAVGGSRLRVRTPYGYIAEVRGQWSANAHGKQGAHPDRIAELRELEEPVLMVFKDHGKIQYVWLDDPGPQIINIDNDPAHRRQGWAVAQMTVTSASGFRFPAEVPRFETRGLF